MKTYFKQDEQSDTSCRSIWQVLRAVWQRFVDFMYDKSDYLLPPEPSQTHFCREQQGRERQQGLIAPTLSLPSLEAERQWLEKIYRNS